MKDSFRTVVTHRPGYPRSIDEDIRHIHIWTGEYSITRQYKVLRDLLELHLNYLVNMKIHSFIQGERRLEVIDKLPVTNP
jgi:hypothetical protein